ncbi:MAG: hypothetical protein JSR98_22160 [Proteobacteria bacterium]|nr:hypothetical protein [Pseudomonadota bacterium]
MAKAKNFAERWLWYASKTSVCVPLDPAAYPTTICGRETVPFPPWACQGPNGGIHIDRRIGRIDVDVAKAPTSRIELNWTCTYSVRVVSRAWLADIRDLIDDNRIGIGEVRRNGRRLEKWATLHEAYAPPMFGADGWVALCPTCGGFHTMVAGRLFFADPGVVGRPLIVNGHGVFVREDLALARNLRTPVGAFKPSVVKFLANPPPFRAAPDWVRASTDVRSREDGQASQPWWRRLAATFSKAMRS